MWIMNTVRVPSHVGVTYLPYLLPGLALLWPLVNFANTNRTILAAGILFTIVIYGLIGSVGLIAILWIVLRGTSPRIVGRICLTLAVIITLFFLWDATTPVRDAGRSVFGEAGAALAYIVPVLTLSVLAWVIGASPHAARLGVIFLVVAIAIPGISFTRYMAARESDTEVKHKQTIVPAARFKPNVYVFISDGYARQDVLARHFAFDNEPFLSELVALGYKVRRDAATNYPATYLSLATLVEMDYVQTPEMLPHKNRAKFQSMLNGRSAAVRRFRAHGYAFAQATGHASGGGCFGIEDRCLDPKQHKWISGAETFGLIRLTPLRHGAFWQPPPEATLRDFRERVEQLPKIQPFFAFIHTLPPHPPFRLDASCNSTSRETYELLETDPKSRPAYVDLIRCVNTTILETAGRLAARDPDAIVIFMSDHGSASITNFKRPLSEWDASQIAERLPILLAVRMPPACAGLGGAARSPVNVMETVFACIEGREPNLRQDRFFIAVYENNLDFGKVRDVSIVFNDAKRD